MTTPLIMLALMTGPWVVARAWMAAFDRRIDPRSAGAMGLALLFGFTAIGHFVETALMAEMLPPWVPARIPLVYATGILEFAFAVGFAVPRLRAMTGRIAVVVLILFFPANIYAAFHQVPMGGHAWGPVYLLIRAPLQIAVLVWIYWFTIRVPGRRPDRRDPVSGE